MTKIELIDAIAERTGMTKKDTAIILDGTIETIMDTVADGDEVRLIGFGKFFSEEKDERTAVNPRTREKIVIPAHKVPKFKFSDTYKKSIA